MRDIVLLATLLGFIAICVGYIRACDWIIGPDEDSDLEIGEPVTETRA